MAERKRDPEKTKARLLKAAGEVLTKRGLYGFHVHEVSKRAGFGKPLVYRYFGDRGQVLNALAEFKAKETREKLAHIRAPENSPLSETLYRQVMFARLLSGDEVLQWLFRAQLTGELKERVAKSLDDLIPRSETGGDEAAAESFLLAGISYVLLLRAWQSVCAGVPIETANDLAAFERAFVKLSSRIEGG